MTKKKTGLMIEELRLSDGFNFPVYELRKMPANIGLGMACDYFEKKSGEKVKRKDNNVYW